MHRRVFAPRALVFVAVGLGIAQSAGAQNLTVVGHLPARHAMTPSLTGPIVIDFDRPVLTASFNATTFRVFGRWSGRALGAFSFSNGDQRVTFTPLAGNRFSAGEMVFVNLSKDLTAADAATLRTAGYAYMYMTSSAPATLFFNEIDEFSNRTPGEGTTRIYGAAAPDLNNDGWLDLCTVNEDSHDLRIFLNRADGTGLYHPFLNPPLPIGVQASPNETADFNNDGNTDMAVAAALSASAWVALGNGDGTFSPAQSITTGNVPHGLAVLDVDGDADWDLCTANTGGNNVSLMINNGSGVFGTATNFEGGGSGEYGLAAGDMNNDGIMDLVVGARISQTVIVQLGNGDGTFTGMPSVPAGGSVWMVSLGDLNGDGNLDVTTSNSFDNSGSILLGNGAGGLASAVVTPAGDHTVATDLGDLDGDGDLDWVLSSFTDGEWRVHLNNGAGVMTYNQSFFANENSSCATLIDFDNDGDLDIVLTDEIADVVTLQKQKGPISSGDVNCDGQIDGKDVSAFVVAMLSPGNYATKYPHCLVSNADIDLNSAVNTSDIAPFVTLLTAN